MRDDHRTWRRQRRRRITPPQLEAEYPEERRICKISPRLRNLGWGPHHYIPPNPHHQVSSRLNPRQLRLDRRRQRHRRRRIGIPEIRPVDQDPVDPVLIDIELIMTFLIRQHQQDQHTDGQRRRQAKYIDKRKYLVLQEIPEPNFKIMEEHKMVVYTLPLEEVEDPINIHNFIEASSA